MTEKHSIIEPEGDKKSKFLDLPYCAWCFRCVGSLDEHLDKFSKTKATTSLGLPPLSKVIQRESNGLYGTTFCSEECASEVESRESRISEADLPALKKFLEHADEINCFYRFALKAILSQDDLSVLIQAPFLESIHIPDEDPEAYRTETNGQTRDSWNLMRAMSSVPEISFEQYDRILGMLCRNTVGVRVPHPLVKLVKKVDEEQDKEMMAKLLPRIRQLAQRRKENPSDSEVSEEEESEEDEDEAEDEDEDEDEDTSDDEDASDDDVDSENDSEEGSDEEEDEEDSESETNDGNRDYEWEDAEGKFQFNSSWFSDIEGAAIYVGTACLNHSCDCNCDIRFNDDATASLVASYDIKAGDELTISYAECDDSLEDRQKDLLGYGFQCSCVCCKEEAAEVEAEAEEAAEPASKKQKTE